jgi:hypothetical protein
MLRALAMGRHASRAIDEAVERLGGVINVSHACQVTTTAVYRWQRIGRIRDAEPLLALAEACEPKDERARWALAKRLASGT